MTFSLIAIENNIQKVVGTVWASDESSARILPQVLAESQAREISLRREEDREIPLRIVQREPFCC
ncbi:MAG TPA: hypothetical protein VFW23_00785 [Tepidisphaeraceae bacterium]|nr:hypothetical protein [Tepidisphaeraceae bacterium]